MQEKVEEIKFKRRFNFKISTASLVPSTLVNCTIIIIMIFIGLPQNLSVLWFLYTLVLFKEHFVVFNRHNILSSEHVCSCFVPVLFLLCSILTSSCLFTFFFPYKIIPRYCLGSFVLPAFLHNVEVWWTFVKTRDSLTTSHCIWWNAFKTDISSDS